MAHGLTQVVQQRGHRPLAQYPEPGASALIRERAPRHVDTQQMNRAEQARTGSTYQGPTSLQREGETKGESELCGEAVRAHEERIRIRGQTPKAGDILMQYLLSCIDTVSQSTRR